MPLMLLKKGVPYATAAKRFDVPRAILMVICNKSGDVPIYKRKMGPPSVLS